MTLDINKLQQKHKQRTRQINNLKQAEYFLREASKDLTTERFECDCCGFGLWHDEPEARMHRSLMSALKQTAKVKVVAVDDLEDIKDLLDL